MSVDTHSISRILREAVAAEYTRRRELERAVADSCLGSANAVSVLRELGSEGDVRLRRSVVEVLRRLAREDAAAVALLGKRLGVETDVKARRRIAAALAESGDPSVVALLLESLEVESHRYVQASLVLALGGLGFSDWPLHWRTRAADEGPVGEAMRKALARADDANVEGAPPRPPGSYLVRTYPGLEALACEEIGRWGSSSPAARGWVLAKVDPGSCAQLRTSLGDYHVVVDGVGDEAWDESLVSACGRIDTLLPTGGRRFRLALPEDMTRLRRTKLVRRLAREVERGTGWVNNTSTYEIELRVIDTDDRKVIGWRHQGWPRVMRDRQAVPASVHPTVAAAMCIAARTDGFAVDPCCGAGTVLMEWRALGGDGAFGSDRSPAAIELARRNVGGEAALAVADLGNLPLADGTADAVLANLPFGVRVKHPEGNRALYARFVQAAQRVLRPGGVLIAYTADENALRAARPDVHRVATVHANGLDVGLFRSTR